MDQLGDYGNGWGWYIPWLPYAASAGGGSDSIVFVFGANDSVWFNKVGTSYVPAFPGSKFSLTHDTANSLFKLADQRGRIHTFNDLSAVPTLKGAYVSFTARGGQVTQYNWDINARRVQSVVRSDPASGVTETFAYTYCLSGVHQNRMQYLTQTRQGGGSPQNVRRVEYVYYEQNEDFGVLNNLKTATAQQWNGSAWVDLNTKYYRYYTSGEAEGFVGGLKYALEPEAFERLSDAVANPFAATDAQVSVYADYHFQYDGELRVSLERVQGVVCGQAHGSFTYEYSENFDPVEGVNNWKRKVVETLPSGDQNILYINSAGQTLLKEFRSGTSSWINCYQYGENGKVVLEASPSAITGYDDSASNLDIQFRANAGFIHLYEYYTSTGGGAAENYVHHEKVKEGSGGTEILLRTVEYHVESAAGATNVLESKVTVYRNDDGTGAVETQCAYEFHAGTVQVLQKTTTFPAVPTTQNGSGIPSTRVDRFDSFGNPTWTKDERGVLTRNRYDSATGALLQKINDVDTSQLTDAPAGWSTVSGFGLHAVHDFEIDDLGRTTLSLGPTHEVDLNGSATTIRATVDTLYLDGAYEIRKVAGYATGSAPNYAYSIINPVEITKLDQANRPIERIRAVRATLSGRLTSSDLFPRSSYVRWSVDSYSDHCQLEWTRVYFSIPSTGEGAAGTNFNQTDFGFDGMGRQNRVRSPGGTITRTVLNPRGYITKLFIGTDDSGATEQDPTGGGATNNNMVQTDAYEYDHGGDGGDGLLTQHISKVDATSNNDRTTNYGFDFRGRRTSVDGEIDLYEETVYDNLDHIVEEVSRDTSPEGTVIEKKRAYFDDLGRVYRNERYAIDPATGNTDGILQDDAWFDASGNIIKARPAGGAVFTKTKVDGLGRPVQSWLAFGNDESYADVFSVSGNTVIEQVTTTFDLAGNEVLRVYRRRFHTATGLGELSSPTGQEPRARVVYSATYPDVFGRKQAVVDVGTNGGSAYSRPATIPNAANGILVTAIVFNSDGEAWRLIDTAGKETRDSFDDAGRRTQRVLNWKSLPSGQDENVTTEWTYTADSLVRVFTRVNPTAGDQVTKYVYGTTLADSEVARADLLRAEIYPDSDDVDSPLADGADNLYDRIEFTYNRQRELTTKTTQNQTTHAYVRDKLGRLIHDRATSLGSGVDDTIRRISTSYDVRGLVWKIASYDNAVIDTGSIVNEVERSYNSFSQLVVEYQEHTGPVNHLTSQKTQYEYADGSANHVRLMELTYPSGRTISYDYGVSGSINDALSRVGAIGDTAADLVVYAYLGAQLVVKADYPEPEIRYDLAMGTGADPYEGFDVFDRIVDLRWHRYSDAVDAERLVYGFDRKSNTIWRATLTDSASQNDELLTYDQVNRLVSFKRGTLNQQHTSLSSPTFAEQWDIDLFGNAAGYRLSLDGTTTWDLDQVRQVNAANEITSITTNSGPEWPTPGYTREGAIDSRPTGNQTALSCGYDAWQRLVTVGSSSQSVQATFNFDGVHRRISESYDDVEVRHRYYTESWRELEVQDGSNNVVAQFVYGIRYLDDIIVRDTGPFSAGVPSGRHYLLQDNTMSTVAIVLPSGDVVERARYSAYGRPEFLDAEFVPIGSSATGWDRLFGGMITNAEMGIALARLRCLDLNLGVWLTREPSRSEAARESNLYQYCGGSPRTYVDPDGDDFIPIFMSSSVHGMGHAAMIIGSDKTGWHFRSQESEHSSGEGKPSSQGDPVRKDFKNLRDALEYAADEGYDIGFEFETDDDAVKRGLDAFEEGAKKGYNLGSNNCAQVQNRVGAAMLPGMYPKGGAAGPRGFGHGMKGPIPPNLIKAVMANDPCISGAPPAPTYDLGKLKKDLDKERAKRAKEEADRQRAMEAAAMNTLEQRGIGIIFGIQ